ncbi:MAG: hypothetical protein A2Z27_04815 [candidate division Zixibacteria bacterium RBG_16_50_21]|nr:MAG: hypothetical protein A2Z27_04815 [candidate division Zixibacteria bacterium RBG_16_50_21]
MKILFLGDARSIHLQRWIEFFNRAGDKTYLISLEKPETQVTDTIILEPKVSTNSLKYLLAVSECRKIVQRINPDLVNAHFVPNYGLIGRRLNRRPLAVSVWGSDILVSAKKSWLHRVRAGWVLKGADWLTSDSLFLTEEMTKLGGDRNKVSTFPMGVAPEFLSDKPKKLSDKIKLTVISTRKMESVYNLNLLISAISMVLEKSEEVNFVLVGEGSQRTKLQSQINRLGLGNRVEFTGNVRQEELVNLLRGADIYVSTSFSDSTSVSLLEAFGSGLVPIVTDIPGNREWIREGENGFLVPVNRSEVLAEKIIDTFRNFSCHQTMVDQNWRVVKDRANYQNNLNVLREKFLELIEQHRSEVNG